MLGRLSDLDLRLVRVFLAVVDASGVSAAQMTLNVGSSTISTQLATLETRLGFRLCDRGRGGFKLTPKGAMLDVYKRQVRWLSSPAKRRQSRYAGWMCWCRK